jgi:glycosyltransferase involved in cell wall biosynthesis
MSVWLATAIVCIVLALIPAIVFAGNLRAFHHLPRNVGSTDRARGPVSVLIPARNEAESIARCVMSVIANRDIDFELIVLDDHSTDQTAAVVNQIACSDDRLRVIAAPPLPAGWCGKQHACWVLAQNARFDTLMWMDADVQLEPNAILLVAEELERNKAALISGFPQEITGTWLEALLIPLIHFILLGFLPLDRMRRDRSPALGAGCGQLFVARRKDYFEAGGHAAIRASLHDGIALPRAFRRTGKGTDLFDASDIARCRMYDSAGAVWYGLLKNAGEGIATPRGIIPWTILLFGGQVLPGVLAVYLVGFRVHQSLAVLVATAAAVSGIAIRLVSAYRYQRQSPGLAKYVSAVAHPIGVLFFLIVQWHSVLRRLTRRRAMWKGRSYD